MKDGSGNSSSRGGSGQTEAKRRERKERAQRMKEKAMRDAYIPPPEEQNESEHEEELQKVSTRRGPRDVAPSTRQRRGSTVRQPTQEVLPHNHSPGQRGAAAADEGEAEEELATTWQRGPTIRKQWNRRTSIAQRPGRANRGAVVQQSQIATMVLLRDNLADASESNNEASEVQEDSENEDENADGEEADLNSSNPEINKQRRSFKPAFIVAKKGGVAAAKGTVAAAKGTAHATKFVGKAGAKAMKGVLGFGRKKKGRHDLNSSTAGLIMEDDLSSEEGNSIGDLNFNITEDNQKVVKTTEILYND